MNGNHAPTPRHPLVSVHSLEVMTSSIEENVVVENPNMKGRLIARLNGEIERIQEEIGKLKSKMKKSETEVKRLEEEKEWTLNNIEVEHEN